MTALQWDKILDKKLPKANQTKEAWELLKSTFKLGDEINDTVICKAPFGAWIDINTPFPALLEIIYIDSLKPEDYKSGKWCLENSRIKAKILAFREDNKQIYLTQLRI